jgi:hypothetical protein
LARFENQDEPVEDPRRVTGYAPKRVDCVDKGTLSREVIGEQGTEERGTEVICMGCRHAVGDKRSKNSGGKPEKDIG